MNQTFSAALFIGYSGERGSGVVVLFESVLHVTEVVQPDLLSIKDRCQSTLGFLFPYQASRKSCSSVEDVIIHRAI